MKRWIQLAGLLLSLTFVPPVKAAATDQPTSGSMKMKIPHLSLSWKDSLMIVGADPVNTGWHSDFCLIKDRAGRWHAIGIGGADSKDQNMFHAVSDSLNKKFEYLPKIECGPSAPAPLHMWAPFAIWKAESLALLYYCHIPEDQSKEQAMRVLESRDRNLKTWVPYSGPEFGGDNVMLRDPGARDACVFWDEEHDAYRLYYASEGIWMRTSKDLIHWSEPKTVITPPPNYQAAESPFVLKRDGYYYLWVSGFDYARMSLYISKDPANFGDPVKNRIEEQNGHACEIVTEEGVDYIGCAAINSNFEKPWNPPGASDLNGVYLQKLAWREATAEEAAKVVPPSSKQ